MATADLWTVFRDAPRRFSPAPIWWWSGERLDPGRLRWQLERFAEGGVYNLVILNLAPTGPLYGSDPDDPPFRSEAWWEIFHQVCEDARELGLFLWFYDQLGFSGANLQGEVVRANPAFAGQWLARLAHDTTGPVQLSCPAGGEPLRGCAVPLTAEGAPAGPAIDVPLAGSDLRWSGSGRHRVMLFYAVTRGFDYFQPAACQALLDQVHTQFERRLGQFFGSVIVGSFQDELPSLPTWSRRFAEEFRQRRGYNLLPHLVYLWEDLGDEAARVRTDHHRVRADLAEEAFFRPLFDWHERRGLICGFDQQGPARAGYPIEATDFYADYLRTHRWFGAPGSDHHGEAKIHSSLAHLYDRPRVWIESFHSSGWGGTLEETFDWLVPWLRAGATLYDPHAVYYSTRGGWWEWAPPSTCWRQPYWRHYRQLATAVSRLCGALSQGSHLCDVGVLYPTTTIQAGLTVEGATNEAQTAHDTYLALVGRMHWQSMTAGVLDGDRRDFDVLDDLSIQRATVDAEALCIGSERYRAVVLPACATLEPATADALRRFVEAGGLLVAVGALPERPAGRDSDPKAVTTLAALFAGGLAHFAARPEEVPNALASLPRRVEAPVPTLLRRVGELTVLFVPAAFPGATRHQTDQDWRLVDYDFDSERYARQMEVTVRNVTGAPELWELTTGERRPLPARQEGDAVTVVVPFQDAPASLLVWGMPTTATTRTASPAESADEQSDDQSSRNRRVEDLIGPWEVELLPTLDNRWGDLGWPPAPGAPPVQRWSFRYRREGMNEDGLALGWAASDADDRSWDEVQATFGVQGYWWGPAEATMAPAPHSGRIEAEASDPLGVAGWRPAIYSLSRGIFRDPLHRATLGPKGHVPEEFLDFGAVPASQAVQYRTTFWVAEPARLSLAIGAAAAKEAWLNGMPLGSGGPGYLWLQPVQLEVGWNVLEFRLTAEENLTLRAYFAFLRDADAFRRPEWLSAGDAAAGASIVRFQQTIALAQQPLAGRLQLGADAPARLVINGQEIGRQGGFDPYDHRRMGRIQPYDITAALQTGQNSVVAELLDLGQPCAMLVDALIADAAGQQTSLISDQRWAVTRDERPVPLALRRRQWQDPAWTHLWRRPHPLPESTWLEEAAFVEAVVPLRPDPCPGETRVEWLRFLLPPGAERMTIPSAGDVLVFVDGSRLPVENGQASLPSPEKTERRCALRISGATGGLGGALLAGPVTFEMGVGQMEPGDWESQGLSAYSGGVAYRRQINMNGAEGGRVSLDLGRVRGTSEVWLNGSLVGSRIWSPYRFDLTEHIRTGANTIEVRVFSTLAPHLAAVSPTSYVFPGQTISGMLGPVRLIYDS